MTFNSCAKVKMEEEDDVEFQFDLSEWMVIDDDVGEAESSPQELSQQGGGNNTKTQSSEGGGNNTKTQSSEGEGNKTKTQSSEGEENKTKTQSSEGEGNKTKTQSSETVKPKQSQPKTLPEIKTSSKTITVPTKISPKEDKTINVPTKIRPKEDKTINVPTKIIPKEDKTINVPTKISPKEDKTMNVQTKISPKEDKTKDVPATSLPSTNSPVAVSNKSNKSTFGTTEFKSPTKSTPVVTKDANAKLACHKSSPSPKVDIASPKVVSVSPKVVNAPPKIVNASTKVEIATHKDVSASPKVVSAAPKTAIGSPKDVVASPKVVSAAPKAVSASPKVVSAAPKAVSASPKVVSAAPKAVSASPLVPNSSLTKTSGTSQMTKSPDTEAKSSVSKPLTTSTVNSKLSEPTHAQSSSGQTQSASIPKTPVVSVTTSAVSINLNTSVSSNTPTSVTKNTSTSLHTKGAAVKSEANTVMESVNKTGSQPRTVTTRQLANNKTTATALSNPAHVKSSNRNQSSNSSSSPVDKTKKADILVETRSEIQSKSGNTPSKTAQSKSANTTRGKQDSTVVLTHSVSSPSDQSTKAPLKQTLTPPTNTSSTASLCPIESASQNMPTTPSSLPQTSVNKSQDAGNDTSGNSQLSKSSIIQKAEMVVTPGTSKLPQKRSSQQPHTAHTPKLNPQKQAKVDSESIAAVMEAVDKFNVKSARQQSFDFDGSDISDTELDDIINVEVKQKLVTGVKRERTETQSEPAKKRLKVDDTVAAPTNPDGPDIVTAPGDKNQQVPSDSLSCNKNDKSESKVMKEVKPDNKMTGDAMASTQVSTDTSVPASLETAYNKASSKATSKRIIHRFHRSTQTVAKQTENKQLQCVLRKQQSVVGCKTTVEFGVQTVGPKKPDWRDEIRHQKLVEGTVKPDIFKFVSEFAFSKCLGNTASATYKYGISLGHVTKTDVEKGSFRENILFKSDSFSVVSSGENIGVVNLLFTDKDGLVSMMTQIRKLRIGHRYLVVTVLASLDENERDTACPLSVVKATIVFDQNFSSTGYLQYSKVPAWNKPKVEVVASIHNVPGGIPLDFLKIVLPDAVSLELEDKRCKFTQEGRRLLVGLTGKNGCDRVFKLFSQIYLNNEYVIPTNTASASRVPEFKELQVARNKWQKETDLLFPASNDIDKEIITKARDINEGKNLEDLSGENTAGGMALDHDEQDETTLAELPDENMCETVGHFDSGLDTNTMEALSDISDTSNLGIESPDKKVNLHEIASLKATLRTISKNKTRKTETHPSKEGNKTGHEKLKAKGTSERQKQEKKVARKEGQSLKIRTQKGSAHKSTSQHMDRKSTGNSKVNIDRIRRPGIPRVSGREEKRSEGVGSVSTKKILSNERQTHLKRRSRDKDLEAAVRGPKTSIRAARLSSRHQKSHDKNKRLGSHSQHLRHQSAETDRRSRQSSQPQNKGRQAEAENTGQLMDTLLRSLSVVELSAKGEHFTRLVTERLNSIIDEQRSRPSNEERWQRARSPGRRQIARRRSASPNPISLKPAVVGTKSPGIGRVFMSRKSLSPQRPPPGRMLSPRPPVPHRNHSPGRHLHDSAHPQRDSNRSPRHNQNRGPSPRHPHVMSPVRASEESGFNSLREGMWLSQPPQPLQGLDPRSNIQIVSGRNREEDLRKNLGASKNLVTIQSEWASVPPGSQTTAGRTSDGQDLLNKFIGQLKRNSQSHPTNPPMSFQDAPKSEGARNNFGGSVNFIDSGIGLGVRNSPGLGLSGGPPVPGLSGGPPVPGTYNPVRRQNTESNQSGLRFDYPYQPQAATNMNWFGRQENKNVSERSEETFGRSQFSGDYQQQPQTTSGPPPIPPPVAPPILSQSLSSQVRISQLEALAKQLAMDIQKQQPTHHGQPYWPFSGQQQQNVMLNTRPQSNMLGPQSQSPMMGPPSQSSMMGPPSQSSMMGPPSQSSMMSPQSQPSMLRGPGPVHMQGYLPQTTPNMSSQPSASFPGANAWQRGGQF